MREIVESRSRPLTSPIRWKSRHLSLLIPGRLRVVFPLSVPRRLIGFSLVLLALVCSPRYSDDGLVGFITALANDLRLARCKGDIQAQSPHGLAVPELFKLRRVWRRRSSKHLRDLWPSRGSGDVQLRAQWAPRLDHGATRPQEIGQPSLIRHGDPFFGRLPTVGEELAPEPIPAAALWLFTLTDIPRKGIRHAETQIPMAATCQAPRAMMSSCIAGSLRKEGKELTSMIR